MIISLVIRVNANRKYMHGMSDFCEKIVGRNVPNYVTFFTSVFYILLLFHIFVIHIDDITNMINLKYAHLRILYYIKSYYGTNFLKKN